MSADIKLASLDEFKSLRKDIGFHFTSQSNIESIMNEGLRPVIGDNASGGLGQSAIPKTYISYGLDGVLQLYNRLISVAFQARVGDLNGISHKPFIPDAAKAKDSNEHLSMIEGFEFVRQYMEDNNYFIFEAPMTQYERSISDEELDEINGNIKGFDEEGIKLCSRFEQLNDRIGDLARSDAQGNRDEILKLVDERNRISLLVREKSLPAIDSKRGQLLNESQNPIMEEIEYNDERLKWINQVENPHNTHTRIIDGEVGPEGVRLTPDMLRLFSLDGQTQGNGLDFLQAMLGKVTPEDQIYLDKPVCHDVNLLYKFLDYVHMVEQYKQAGLLSVKPEETIQVGDKRRNMPARLVMDMSDIDKYPGLAEFSENLEQYYEANRYKKKIMSLGEESLEKNKDTKRKKDVESQMANDEKSLETTQDKIKV